MSSRGGRRRGLLDQTATVISLGLVMSVLGASVIAGDVALGSIVLTQSSFFGGVTLTAGLLFLLGGGMAAVRSYRKKRGRR